MRSARSIVNKEWLVRRKRFLELSPLNRLVGHIDGEVIIGVSRCLNQGDTIVECRRILIGFSTDKTIELFKTAPSRPTILRTYLRNLPGWNFVALTEKGSVVSILTKNFC